MFLTLVVAESLWTFGALEFHSVQLLSDVHVEYFAGLIDGITIGTVLLISHPLRHAFLTRYLSAIFAFLRLVDHTEAKPTYKVAVNRLRDTLLGFKLTSSNRLVSHLPLKTLDEFPLDDTLVLLHLELRYVRRYQADCVLSCSGDLTFEGSQIGVFTGKN